MKHALLVGGGGIGSYFVRGYQELTKVEGFNQFPNLSLTVADDDTVDTDNLPYQNFELADVMDSKVKILEAKYGIVGIEGLIETEDQFKGFDVIISAVDNTSFRKMLFKYVFKKKNENAYWIDLRSEGRTISAYSKHKKHTLKSMQETLPKKEVKDGSCQLKYEKEAGIFQTGNKTIACLGVQMLLNWTRGDTNRAEFSMRT